MEPVTCKNMHTNEHFSPTVCHAGCNCKTGYVLDSKNKKCVKPNECPCHHGGRSYKEKSIGKYYFRYFLIMLKHPMNSTK